MRPPGRTTRASSAKNGPSSTRLRSANPHVTPSTRAVGHGQAQDVGLHQRRAAAVGAAASRTRGRRPIGRCRPPRARRQRSPVPHARSRTRAAGRQGAAPRTVLAPPAHVQAERHDPVDEVVAGGDRVEHLAAPRAPSRRPAGRCRGSSSSARGRTPKTSTARLGVRTPIVAGWTSWRFQARQIAVGRSLVWRFVALARTVCGGLR